MKWITIGDIHGRDNWKSIDITQYDKVIFMGDYVDGREEQSCF
jgi:predicted phosphodiesterase